MDEKNFRLLKYQLERRDEFRKPQFDYFISRFEREPPASLRRLYELGDGLFCESFSRDCGARYPLWIQFFHPLNCESIDYCSRYDFRLFSFATGEDGQQFLISFEDGCPISVEFEIDEDAPEPIHISFDRLVDAIVACPPVKLCLEGE